MPDVEVADASEIGIGTAPASPEGKSASADFLSPADDAAAPSQEAPKPDDGTAQAPPKEPFDWNTVDYRRTDPKDVPEQYRPAFERMQKQAREAQAEGTRQLEDARRQQQDIEAQRKELIALQRDLVTSGRQTTQQDQKDAAREVKKKATELLNDPAVDAETRKGLVLVRDMASEIVADAVAGLEKKFEERLKPLSDTVQTFSAREHTERRNALAAQVTDAKDKYGADVDAYTDEICRALGLNDKFEPVGKPLLNRATGKPHTVASAYELYSGKTAAQAQEARSEDAAIRSGTKANARSPSSATLPTNGKMSESDLRAAVDKLFA